MDKNELAALRMNPRQEVTLRPGKAKWWAILLICAGAAIIGAVMALKDHDAHGWVVLVVFGVLASFAARQLFSSKNYLRLTATGLEVRSLLRSYDARWDDIGNIGVVYYRRNVIVAFDYLSPNSGDAKRRKQNKAALKYEEAIPETYGLDGNELAELLASRRDAAR